MQRYVTFALDFGSALLFLGVLLATGDIYLATGLGIAAGVASLAWIWLRDRRIGAMQALGPSIVVVMGAATLLLHDPRFVMLKPTLIMGFLGAAMLKPGWMISVLPPAAAEAPRSLLVALGYVYAATHFVLAAGNVIVACLASQKTWAILSATVPWAVIGLLALATWRIVRRSVAQVRQAGAEAA